LFDHFLKRHSRRLGKTVAVQPEVLDTLSGYGWPGNVRELENVIERAVTLNSSGILTTADFRECVRQSEEIPTRFPKELVPLQEIEKQYVLHVISRCDGNMTKAAEVLQIDRRTLYRMLERFGVETRQPIDQI